MSAFSASLSLTKCWLFAFDVCNFPKVTSLQKLYRFFVMSRIVSSATDVHWLLYSIIWSVYIVCNYWCDDQFFGKICCAIWGHFGKFLNLSNGAFLNYHQLTIFLSVHKRTPTCPALLEFCLRLVNSSPS